MYKNKKQIIFIITAELIISAVTALCISLITGITVKIFFATLLISAAVCAVIDIFLPVDKIITKFKNIFLSAIIFTLIFVPVTTFAASFTACKINDSYVDKQILHLETQRDIYKKQLKTKHISNKSKNELQNSINGINIRLLSIKNNYSSFGETFGISIAIDFVCGMIIFASGTAILNNIIINNREKINNEES